MREIAFVLSIALPIADWTVASILVVAAWRFSVVPLRERAVAAVVLAFAATGVAVILANRELGHPISSDISAALVLAVVVFISIPALYWFWLLLSGGFEE